MHMLSCCLVLCFGVGREEFEVVSEVIIVNSRGKSLR